MRSYAESTEYHPRATYLCMATWAVAFMLVGKLVSEGFGRRGLAFYERWLPDGWFSTRDEVLFARTGYSVWTDLK